MIEFLIEDQQTATTNTVPSIKVIGVGGAGGNTVNSLVDFGCEHIFCIAANTDGQALELSKAQQKIQLGVKATKGLGTGANPELGKHAAEEDLDKIVETIGNADIVFLTAGMGGGTGSGALPVIAHALAQKGILTIALVTKPFSFEGKRRAYIAEKAIELLKNEVDSLIVIPNQRLLEIVDESVSMVQAFSLINDMLGNAVKGIADIITKPGYINVDFADVKSIMKGMGLAVMGTGRASGDDRAKQAALSAISSPLLENMSICGARGVLLNITGSANLRLHEISEAASVIYEQAADDAHIILGSVIDETMGDDVLITVIATGFECQSNKKIQPAQVATTNEKDIQEYSVKGVSVQEDGLLPDAALFSDDLDQPTFLRRQQVTEKRE